MVKNINLLIVVTLLLSFSIVSSAESVCLENTFQLNEEVNYPFNCYTQTGNYCSSTTILIINVISPTGSSALNNITMTYNGSNFNVTLPTNVLGRYKALIHSTTSNNTITEFPYDVTPTGDCNGTSYIFVNIILFVLLSSLIIGFIILKRKIDFLKWKEKIIRKYEDKNPMKAVFAGLFYSVAKDTFLILYLLGFPLLILIEDLLRTYNVVTLNTLIVNVIDFYSIGIFIALALFVGSAYRFLKEIFEEYSNMKWGVNEA